MRYHSFFNVSNDVGIPIVSANINIYLANSTTPAKIWSAEIAGTFINTIPQRVTDATTGFFEFWVDSTDYSLNQKFKIEILKDSTNIQSIDYISIMNGLTHNDLLNIQGDSTTGEYYHITLSEKAIFTAPDTSLFLGT